PWAGSTTRPPRITIACSAPPSGGPGADLATEHPDSAAARPPRSRVRRSPSPMVLHPSPGAGGSQGRRRGPIVRGPARSDPIIGRAGGRSGDGRGRGGAGGAEVNRG